MELEGLIRIDPTDEHTLETSSNVLGDAFFEECWYRFWVSALSELGLDESYQRTVCRATLHEYVRRAAALGDAFALPGLEGVLIIVPAQDADRMYGFSDSEAAKDLLHLPSSQFDALAHREMELEPVTVLNWEPAYCPSGYISIPAVAVAESARGTGAFRRLFTPLLASADRADVPVCLECYREGLVELYEHFGFEVIESIREEKLSITEYLMIRKSPQ